MGRFTRRFTEEQEREILSLYFTNPFADVAFIKPMPGFGPEEQASLAAKFSRDPEPYQKKFLKLIEKGNDVDMGLIAKLAEDPKSASLGLTGSLSKDAARFHTQWSLGMQFSPEEKDTAIRGFGDDSVKDGGNILYHVENVLDNDNKIITQNPRNRPQVASTRYIDFTTESRRFEGNPDISRSKYGEEILGVMRMLGEAYAEFSDMAERFVAEHPLNKEFQQHWLSEESLTEGVREWQANKLRTDPERTFSEKEFSDIKEKLKKARAGPDYQKYARKTIFDYTRYLLFPGISTHMAVASDTNTLERDVTNFLSSPMQTARDLGETILAEGRKLCPTLLGRHTHARRSDFLINLRQELSDFVREKVESERTKTFEPTARTNSIDLPSYNDAIQAAATVYPYANSSLKQLYGHFVKNPRDISHVVNTLLRLRGKFDQDPEELLHGGLMRETLIDYGADRDLQRHRRGYKTKQLLTTYHGFETPDLFKAMGVDARFAELMQKADSTYCRIADDNPHTAQLMVPFAFKLRRLYSWQFGQDLFVGKLRSGEGGIISYRRVAWDIEEADRARMPEFSRLFRVNRNSYPPELINLKESREWYNQIKRGREYVSETNQ